MAAASPPIQHHADAPLGVSDALLEHQERFHGAPRTIRVADLRRPVYFAVGEYGDTLACAGGKNHHERNDTVYFAGGCALVNTVVIVGAFCMPAYALAAIALLGYVYYALALVPYALQLAVCPFSALLQHYLLMLLSWTGLVLLAAHCACVVLWLAFATAGWRLRLLFASVQVMLMLLIFGLEVALVNMRHAYLGFATGHTDADKLAYVARDPAQAPALNPAGRRVAEHYRQATRRSK